MHVEWITSMHPTRKLFSRITIGRPFWLGVAIILLVGVSTAALIGILHTSDAVKQEAQRRFFEQYNLQQLVLAEQAAHSIEETFATYRRNLSLVASLFENGGVTQARAQQLSGTLQRMYESLQETDIIDLVVFDRDGTVVAISPSDEYTLGRNYAWRNYYIWARDSGRPGQMYLSPFMRLEGGQNRGDKALIVAQGIYDHDGRFDGVAMFTVNFDKLARRQVLSVRIGEYGFAWLVDNNEQSVLVDPLGRVNDMGFEETFLPRWPQLYNLLMSMQDGKPGTGSYDFVDPADPAQPVSKLVGYQPIRIEDRLWTLGVATPTREVDALLSSFLQQQERYSGTLVLIIFTGTFILLTALLSWNHILQIQIDRRTRDLADARSELEST
ncbi:MAG: cache domain-containing protein, partial [Sedimenticola sp.]|nr:cache domain-containing protein [Sedimenticola sp.]